MGVIQNVKWVSGCPILAPCFFSLHFQKIDTVMDPRRLVNYVLGCAVKTFEIPYVAVSCVSQRQSQQRLQGHFKQADLFVS